MPDFSKKKNIIHVVEWVIAVIIAGLIADLVCFDCYEHIVRNQFIVATVYGYLIVSSLLFLAVCVGEEIPEKTGYAISALGALLYLVTGILLAVYLDDTSATCQEEIYYRVLVALILCFVNALLYGIEFFLSLFKKSVLE